MVNQNRAALLAATGQGSASLDQARSANAALAKQDAASLADDSGAPQALQARICQGVSGLEALAPACARRMQRRLRCSLCGRPISADLQGIEAHSKFVGC